MSTTRSPVSSRPAVRRRGGHLQEWRKALRMSALWSSLALEDLRDRYHRTVIGLAWIIVSFALFVAVKVAVFGQLTPAPAAEFGLFVTIGFGVWTFINSMVLDACTAYMHAKPWIEGTTTPYPVYLLQVVCRNWIIFLLVFAVVLLALAFKPTPWTPAMLWAVPGLLAYLVASVWLAGLLAPLCLRFRDLHHALQTGMRLVFFATPILWMPQVNERLATIAAWNPVTHFLAVVRDPLLYDRVPVESWWVVAAVNVAGILAAAWSYAASRRNIVFWI
jgi:ABC-type polysaccharide/polyol phosphate export permease